MLDKVTKQTFEPIKGGVFQLVIGEGQTIPLELSAVLGTGLQIVKYRYRLVLTAHDASGNKGVAGLRFKYGAGRTTRR